MSKPITLYLAADHAGYALKEQLKSKLSNHQIIDLSPKEQPNDDYPQHAMRLAKALQENSQALGVAICGSGHGMDIAANRYKGIRAIVARTPEDAKLSREHNHANILVLGGRITKLAKAKSIVETFMKTKPSKAARHIRRVTSLDTLS